MLMLYSCVEMARAFLSEPTERASHAASLLFGHGAPMGKMPGAREASAFFGLTERLAKSYAKPQWRIESAQVSGRAAPVVIERLDEMPFGNLIRFAKQGVDPRSQPKLLIVAPMSGHYPTLLRDTVEALLPTHDVHLTEWINARDVPLARGEFSLDDYVHYIIRYCQLLGASADGRALHLMSVCQPTVPALGAVSLMSQRKDPNAPQSMIMIGGPIDARKSPTVTNNFALKHDIGWFERNLISMVSWPNGGAGRLVYPGFLQHMGFVAMNPSRHAQAHREFFENLVQGLDVGATKHREFYDEYNAVMDLPKEYYLRTVESVFQKFELARGVWDVAGERVNPAAIEGTALLTLEGELDDISGAGQTHSAQELCVNLPASMRERWTAPGVGHYGVFSGSKFETIIAPRIEAFIKKQQAQWERGQGAKKSKSR